jgi:hypothetical protein
VTRPVGDNDDYDIDVVCKLNATKHDFTMAQLKAAVGAEIRVIAHPPCRHAATQTGFPAMARSMA